MIFGTVFFVSKCLLGYVERGLLINPINLRALQVSYVIRTDIVV